MEKGLSDIELAMQLGVHIENPCSTVANGKNYDIRDFYIRLAKEIMPKLTNPFAYEFLESLIKQYK